MFRCRSSNKDLSKAPKPITSSNGGMIAHIVNNRANAAVPKRKPVTIDSDSDSEMDLQSALAKARKQKAPEKRIQPAPVPSNTKNPFDGPLPFEKLDLGTSIFNKKKIASERPISDAEDGEEEDMAGGFDNALEKEAPRPLPPWMVGKDDIRSQVEIQREQDLELDAEDRERALEEEREYQKKYAPIEIDSSDNESDVEIVDAPPPNKSPVETLGEVAENTRAEPPVSAVQQHRQPSVEAVEVQEEHQEVQEDEEEVDWSESDYGDAVKKSAKAVDVSHPAGGRTDAASSRSKSASPEFEDVEMPEVGRNIADMHQQSWMMMIAFAVIAFLEAILPPGTAPSSGQGGGSFRRFKSICSATCFFSPVGRGHAARLLLRSAPRSVQFSCRASPSPRRRSRRH